MISAGAKWTSNDCNRCCIKSASIWLQSALQGRPETMQDNPQYENVVRTIMDYFVQENSHLQGSRNK
jgi:hypothetical protein